MSNDLDFLAMPWFDAEKYLLAWRAGFNAGLPIKDRVDPSDLTVLVARAGGAEHRRDFPERNHEHYEFQEICRSLLRDSGGKVLPQSVQNDVPDLICAWFPRNSAAAITGVATLHTHLRRSNDSLRPHLEWRHERHAVVGIGATEYSAFRMLELARHGQTVVDPGALCFSDDAFRALAQVIDIRVADVKGIARDVGRSAGQQAAALLALTAARGKRERVTSVAVASGS